MTGWSSSKNRSRCAICGSISCVLRVLYRGRSHASRLEQTIISCGSSRASIATRGRRARQDLRTSLFDDTNRDRAPTQDHPSRRRAHAIRRRRRPQSDPSVVTPAEVHTVRCGADARAGFRAGSPRDRVDRPLTGTSSTIGPRRLMPPPRRNIVSRAAPRSAGGDRSPSGAPPIVVGRWFVHVRTGPTRTARDRAALLSTTGPLTACTTGHSCDRWCAARCGRSRSCGLDDFGIDLAQALRVEPNAPSRRREVFGDDAAASDDRSANSRPARLCAC